MADSPELVEEIEGLLALDEDELSAELARADPAASDTLYSFASARDRGREILGQMSSTLRTRICEDWDYCARRKRGDFGDDVTLAVSVADVILTSVGGLPVALVAALVVKRGLRRFCACTEE